MAALPTTCDWAIIGGGFAGASTAYALAQRGERDIVILEREAICGYHASGRNAALCRQLTELDAFTEFTVAGARFLHAPPTDFSEVSLVEPTGSLLSVQTESELQALVATADRFGIACHTLTKAAVVERWSEVRNTELFGAVFFPDDGVIDVHALLHAFLTGASRVGARVFTGCDVVDFRSSSESIELITSRGSIHAKHVVNAAGAWASPVGALATGHSHSVTPYQRHLFTLAMPKRPDNNAPFLWHISSRDQFYVRREGTGLLVSACDSRAVDPYDAIPDPLAHEILARKFIRVAAPFADLAVTRAWACLRTFTENGAPWVGWDDREPRLFWVVGLAGHGATASYAIGDRAAALLLARRE